MELPTAGSNCMALSFRFIASLQTSKYPMLKGMRDFPFPDCTQMTQGSSLVQYGGVLVSHVGGPSEIEIFEKVFKLNIEFLTVSG